MRYTDLLPILYHGSYYLTDTLKPGINYTEEEIFWDHTESNRFLYATTDYQFAMLMGFCSSLTQIGVNVNHFTSNNNIITIECDPPINKTIIDSIDILYVYHIKSNKFIKNNNEYNNTDTEYKTDSVILSDEIIKTDTIKISDFIDKFHIRGNFI